MPTSDVTVSYNLQQMEQSAPNPIMSTFIKWSIFLVNISMIKGCRCQMEKRRKDIAKEVNTLPILSQESLLPVTRNLRETNQVYAAVRHKKYAIKTVD
jgi:hypothetical protein